MSEIIDNLFEKIERIGEGSYGIVYKARDRNSNALVALKKIRLNSDSEGIPSTALREVTTLKSLQHKNVVRLFDVISSNNFLYLAFEYLQQDLKKLLDNTESGLPPRIVKSYMWQLMQGMAYCHQRLVLHRDLKPQNLLIDRSGYIKIGDFGLARSMTIPMRVYTHEVITLWYRSPEVLLGTDYYGPSTDQWSLGCIFAEMCTKRALFSGDSEIDQLYRIFRVLGTPPEQFWPSAIHLADYKTSFPKWKEQDLSQLLPELDSDVIDLIRKLLVYNPHKRLQARKSLEHPYFNDVSICLPSNYLNLDIN